MWKTAEGFGPLCTNLPCGCVTAWKTRFRWKVDSLGRRVRGTDRVVGPSLGIGLFKRKGTQFELLGYAKGQLTRTDALDLFCPHQKRVQ